MPFRRTTPARPCPGEATMNVGDRTYDALRSSYPQIPLRARRRALSATWCSSRAAIQDRSIMLSKLANGAVDPLVTLMYRVRRNPACANSSSTRAIAISS